MTDILIKNPYGGGAQIILDIAITGVNGQTRHSDQDTDQPLRLRFNQKKAKYGQIAQDNGLSFIPAFFSHTGQIHQAIMDLMFNQIKLKLELADPQVQSDKIQGTLRFWVRQLTSVIKKTACRSILAGAASLVDSSANSTSGDDRTSEQRDDQLAANSSAAHNFIEDMDLSMINQEHLQL